MAKVLRDHQAGHADRRPRARVRARTSSGCGPRSPGVADELWELAQEHMTRGSMFDASGAVRLVVGHLADAPHGQLGDADRQHGGPEEHRRPARGDAAAVRRRAPERAVRAAPPTSSGARTRTCGPSGSTSTTTRRTSPSIKAAIKAHEGAPHAPTTARSTSTARVTCRCRRRRRSRRRRSSQRRRAATCSRPSSSAAREQRTGATRCSGPRPPRRSAWTRTAWRPRRSAPGWSACRSASRCGHSSPYMLDPDLESPVRVEGLPNLSMVEGVRLDDRGPRVVIGSIDSRVRNRVDDTGCSVDDLIADEADWPSHVRVPQARRRDRAPAHPRARDRRLEAAAITVAAARSGVGR